MSRTIEGVEDDVHLSQEQREELPRAMLEGKELARRYRVVPHEKVREWLLSMDTDNPLPRPRGEPI